MSKLHEWQEQMGRKADDENRRAVNEEQRQAASDWLRQLDGIPDNQLINVYVGDHNSGATSTKKYTAGELRRRLEVTVRGRGQDTEGEGFYFDSQDSYRIAVVTPEIEAREREEHRDRELIGALKARGIPETLFLDFDRLGVESVRFTPA